MGLFEKMLATTHGNGPPLLQGKAGRIGASHALTQVQPRTQDRGDIAQLGTLSAQSLDDVAPHLQTGKHPMGIVQRRKQALHLGFGVTKQGAMYFVDSAQLCRRNRIEQYAVAFAQAMPDGA